MLTRNPDADSQNEINHYPYYAPRIWHGFALSKWLRLVAKHRFRIDRIYMAAWITFFGAVNSVSNRMQAAKFGKQARTTPLKSDPIFVLGHWRTGTTLLHTLFSLDERYATPTNYDCFCPRHFVLTHDWYRNLMKFPSRRPMDNMSFGWDTPQEDEMAMCVRGQSSVYLNSAFPNDPKSHLDSLDFNGYSEKQIEKWKSCLREFVQYLNVKYERPIVLKSPPHTGRIPVLLEMYPNAKFVHISRNPFEFIPSTFHLWRALGLTSGLQVPNQPDVNPEYVFDCFHRIYNSYERHKEMIPRENLVELRFEDLTADPIQVLRETYRRLSLPEFSEAEAGIKQFVDAKKDYKRNKHEIPAALKQAIVENCSGYIERYGYTSQAEVQAA